MSPADLFARVSAFSAESAYVAQHLVRLNENIGERLKVMYHYLARGTEFVVDADTSTVVIDGRRRSWMALDSIDTIHGVDGDHTVIQCAKLGHDLDENNRCRRCGVHVMEGNDSAC